MMKLLLTLLGVFTGQTAEECPVKKGIYVFVIPMPDEGDASVVAITELEAWWDKNYSGVDTVQQCQ